MKNILIVNIMLLLLTVFAYLPNTWADSLEVVSDSLDDAMMQYVQGGTNQTKNNGTCTYQWIGVHSDSVCRSIWNKQRQLIYFPVSQLPADQIIDSAFIRSYLYAKGKYTSCTLTPDIQIYAYPLLREWGEGARCAATAITGECSWNVAKYGTVNWTIGGAGSIGNDIQETEESACVIDSSNDDIWVRMPVTEFVKDLYDGTIADNYGVLLKDPRDTLTRDNGGVIGMYQFGSTEHDSMPSVVIYYHEPDAPDSMNVTTWDSEHSERASPQDTLNFGYTNPDSSHLVDFSPRFSAVCEIDSATHYYIRVGKSVGGTTEWNSGWTSMADTVYKDDRTKKITYGGNAIEDGYKYYWSIALAHTVTGDTSDFCADQTFYGTSAAWWDSSYNNRQNIWFGTDHDAIAAGQIIRIPLPTGYGHVFAENALSLDGGQGQMIYYQGFSYFAYVGRDTADGSTGNYIIKYDHTADTFSAYYKVEDDVDTLMSTYGDWHYFPQIIIDSELHKLHFIRNGHDNQAAYYISSDSSFADSGINITNWVLPVFPSAFESATYIRLDEVSNGDIFATFRHYGDSTGGADPEHHSRGYYCYSRLAWNGSGWASWSARKYIVFYWDDIQTQSGRPSLYCGGMTIDGNDRMHIALSFWDSYGASIAAGRAIAHIYSDYDTVGSDTGYIKWYELASTDSIGVTTGAADSSLNIHYASINPIDTCDNANTNPLGSNRILVNADIMVLDDNNYPVVFYPKYDSLDFGGSDDSQADECSLFCVRWVGGTDTGQHWDIYNVSVETGYLCWHTRLFGAANIVNDMVSWFFITKPDSGGDYYAGEDVRCRGKGFLTADSGGVNWSTDMMSGNSGSGIGRLNAYKGVPDSVRYGFVQKRKQNLVYMQDRIYGRFRADGNDIRIIYTSSAGAHTELDRVPLLAFQLDTTYMAFDFGLYTISSNYPAPNYGCLYVYWNNSDADTPPANPDSIWEQFYGCEVDSADVALSDSDSLGLMDANIVSSGYEIGVSTAYADRMWSGNQYAKTNGDANPAVCTLTVTANTTNKDVYVHIRPMAVPKTSKSSFSYVELLDGTKPSRVYFSHGDSTINYLNGSQSQQNSSIGTLPNQYYTLKFHVHDTDGITAIINDIDTVFADVDSIVQFDKIIFYGLHTDNVNSSWDVLMIEKFIDNDVEVWFAPEQHWSIGIRKKVKLVGVYK